MNINWKGLYLTSQLCHLKVKVVTNLERKFIFITSVLQKIIRKILLNYRSINKMSKIPSINWKKKTNLPKSNSKNPQKSTIKTKLWMSIFLSQKSKEIKCTEMLFLLVQIKLHYSSWRRRIHKIVTSKFKNGKRFVDVE